MSANEPRDKGPGSGDDGAPAREVEQPKPIDGADPHNVFERTEPLYIRVPTGDSVITAVKISQGRVITASDDRSIKVYDLATGRVIHWLDGHEGGIWSIAVSGNTLVSGSTDRTLRVWDLVTGHNTHIFGGHTSTVRCVAIVEPELTEVEGEDGVVIQETWPKSPIVVTGSRDHTLRMWKVPLPGDDEYRYHSPGLDRTELGDDEVRVD